MLVFSRVSLWSEQGLIKHYILVSHRTWPAVSWVDVLGLSGPSPPPKAKLDASGLTCFHPLSITNHGHYNKLVYTTLHEN